MRWIRRVPICYSLRMAKVSAGLLMYRVRDGELEFLLAHPGGPFWKERGPRSVDDSQGRNPGRRRDARGCTARIRRGDWHQAGGNTHRIDVNQAKGRKDCPRLGVRRRLQHDVHQEQHLSNGMAAQIRAISKLSGGGPCLFLSNGRGQTRKSMRRRWRCWRSSNRNWRFSIRRLVIFATALPFLARPNLFDRLALAHEGGLVCR